MAGTTGARQESAERRYRYGSPVTDSDLCVVLGLGNGVCRCMGGEWSASRSGRNTPERTPVPVTRAELGISGERRKGHFSKIRRVDQNSAR